MSKLQNKIQMADKCMKRCSAVVVFRKMQIKTMMRSDFTLSDW